MRSGLISSLVGMYVQDYKTVCSGFDWCYQTQTDRETDRQTQTSF